MRVALPPLLMLLAAACASGPRAPDPPSEDRQLNRAVDLIERGDLDEAERILRAVDAADSNEWLERLGLPARHWIAADYLAVIERRRDGDRSDRLFRSKRFRFHVHADALAEPERARVAATFERMLTRVADWAPPGPWRGDDPRTVFVEIADSFDSPSPARTLIFFWDRQERSPRMEVTSRVLTPRFLEPLLAHELTHLVLPHTCRPLAEGVADLAMSEICPGRSVVRRRPGEPERWPLEDVLRYDYRGQGERAREVYDAIATRGFDDDMRRVFADMYSLGDDLVRMLDERWGLAKLLEFYLATNRDPATHDIVRTIGEDFEPFDELRAAWQQR